MDILVLLADRDDCADLTHARDGRPVAHVRSTPNAPGHDAGVRRRAREIVTLYGTAEVDCLAVAIAAACESRRADGTPPDAVRQLGVWADRGAVGDVAWRDRVTGQVVTQDVAISAAAIAGTAGRLLVEHGRAIRQTVAGLAMADWPEGTSRAIQVSLCLASDSPPQIGAADVFLASVREADGYNEAFDDYFAS